ncbi:hypothetical protein DND58_30340, partial [Pseudomonas syringae pv. pisi]
MWGFLMSRMNEEMSWKTQKVGYFMTIGILFVRCLRTMESFLFLLVVFLMTITLFMNIKDWIKLSTNIH